MVKTRRSVQDDAESFFYVFEDKIKRSDNDGTIGGQEHEGLDGKTYVEVEPGTEYYRGLNPKGSQQQLERRRGRFHYWQQ